jgi:hypothetical protein
MNFDRPWILLLAWLPVAWAAWEWRSSGRRKALVLRPIVSMKRAS